MVTLTINGMKVQIEEGTTILEACRWLGINIPTLCYHEGLSPYGACRLCSVEIVKGKRARLVASCLYPVEEGLGVWTHSQKVVKARKMIVELLLSSCPNSKKLQDLASQMGVEKVRFKMEESNCILCGLCVRMCSEQMMAGAIGFINRGYNRKVATAFNARSEVCRNCGACMYICPVVEVQCRGVKSPGELCNACLNFSPTCLELYPDVMCFMDSCGSCVRDQKTEDRRRKPEDRGQITNL